MDTAGQLEFVHDARREQLVGHYHGPAEEGVKLDVGGVGVMTLPFDAILTLEALMPDDGLCVDRLGKNPRFNDAVTAYNIYRQSFPPTIFAGMFGHTQDASLLEFDSAAIAEAPKVSFS